MNRVHICADTFPQRHIYILNQMKQIKLGENDNAKLTSLNRAGQISSFFCGVVWVKFLVGVNLINSVNYKLYLKKYTVGMGDTKVVGRSPQWRYAAVTRFILQMRQLKY